MKGKTDPPTFEEYRLRHTPLQVERMVLRVMPDILFSERVGVYMNNMPKRVFDTPAGLPDFLISDSVLAMTNGLQSENGHYALPLSPRRLLIAADKQSTLDNATDMSPKELVGNMNKWTVEMAAKFVAAVDRSQDRFIRNRFGRKLVA